MQQDAAERESNTARKTQLQTENLHRRRKCQGGRHRNPRNRAGRAISSLRAADQIEVDRQRQENSGLKTTCSMRLAEKRRRYSLQELQTESQRLAKTLEEERAQAPVRLAEIEKREQEALALIEQAEQKRALAAAAPDSSINENAHIIQTANASHAGVAPFWTAFATTGSSAEGIGRETPAEVEASGALTVIQNESPPPKYASASAGQDPLAVRRMRPMT